MSEADILTEATEGICWHKNNFSKSIEDGINECNIPEFMKVTLKRASNKTQHRGLYSSTSSETLDEGSHSRRNWKLHFEGKSMHASMGADYDDVIDFGDGLSQKMRSLSACSEDAVSVNVGLLADLTNSISDYGEGTRQKMERGAMKDIDGTSNFSIEIGDGKVGIDHTLDFGEGTTEKSEAGHLKSAVKGKTVNISNDDAEDPAFDAALRSSSWMTRDQLESFIRVALRSSSSKENHQVAYTVEALQDVNFVEAVVTAGVEAVATFSSQTSSESSALEQLVSSMNAKMKRVYVEKATRTMSKEQMRSFVIEAYDARERGSVKAAIETMTALQIQETLQEMTATMDTAEKREFATESIASLDREALEKIFDRAAKTMTKEEFQSSLTRLEEEVEEMEKRKREYAEKGESEKLEKEEVRLRSRSGSVGLGSARHRNAGLGSAGAKMEKAEKNLAVRNQAKMDEEAYQSKAAVKSETTAATRSEVSQAKSATTATKSDQKESTMKAEMRLIEEKQKAFFQQSDEFKQDCRIFQEKTSAFKQQVSLYKEESSSFKKSVASFCSKSSTYKESEEILRRQLSAGSCERDDCVGEREEMAIRIRELTKELAEAKMSLMEAKALKVVAVGETTMQRMEETRRTETKMRKETKELEAMFKEVEVKEEQLQTRVGPNAKAVEMRSNAAKTKRDEAMAVESSSSKSAAMTEKHSSSEMYLRKSKESQRAGKSSFSTSSSKAIDHSESGRQMKFNAESRAEKSSSSSSSSSSFSSSKAIEQRESQCQMEAISEMESNSNTFEQQRMTVREQTHRGNSKQIIKAEMNELSEGISVAESKTEMKSLQAQSNVSSSMTQIICQETSSAYEELEEKLRRQLSAESQTNLQAQSNVSSSETQAICQETSSVYEESEEKLRRQLSAESRTTMLAPTKELSQSETKSIQREEGGHSESSQMIAIQSSKMASESVMEYNSSQMLEMNGSPTESTSTQMMNSRRQNENQNGEFLCKSEVLAQTSAYESTTEERCRYISEGETLTYNTQIVAAEAEMTEMSVNECRRELSQMCHEERSSLKERTLSWQNLDARSIEGRNELRSEPDADEGEGISWHHINYKSAEDEKNQPEFLKAKLRKTSFGPTDRERRRKSSGSDTSSR